MGAQMFYAAKHSRAAPFFLKGCGFRVESNIQVFAGATFSEMAARLKPIGRLAVPGMSHQADRPVREVCAGKSGQCATVLHRRLRSHESRITNHDHAPMSDTVSTE